MHTLLGRRLVTPTIQSQGGLTSIAAPQVAGALHSVPLNAHQKGDALLFHGCSQEAATNIQTEGLQLRFAAHGMLGQGLYGAPDPNKSRDYCKGGANGNFMFICRFNLSDARHAGLASVASTPLPALSATSGNARLPA